MRTLIYLKIGLIIGLISITKYLNSQSTTNNNTPLLGKFLGYNAAGSSLDFRTNNINRMRLMENGSATINTGLQTVNYNGFLGLSADPAYWTSASSPQAPVSLLHLAER